MISSLMSTLVLLSSLSPCSQRQARAGAKGPEECGEGTFSHELFLVCIIPPVLFLTFSLSSLLSLLSFLSLLSLFSQRQARGAMVPEEYDGALADLQKAIDLLPLWQVGAVLLCTALYCFETALYCFVLARTAIHWRPKGVRPAAAVAGRCCRAVLHLLGVALHCHAVANYCCRCGMGCAVLCCAVLPPVIIFTAAAAAGMYCIHFHHVLPCTALYCSVPQCSAVYCYVLPYISICFHVLPSTSICVTIYHR